MQIANRFTGTLAPDSLHLKQSAIPDRLIRGAEKDGVVYLTVAIIVVASGLPAWFVAQLWSTLGIQSLLNFPTVTFWTVFKLIYLLGIACVVPMVLLLLSFKLFSKNLSSLSAALLVTRSGICWKSNNPLTLLTLKVSRQATQPVPWNEIVAVTTGQSASQLSEAYQVISSKESYKSEYDFIRPIGISGNINFVSKGTNGKLRSRIGICMNALSKESKRDLALAVERYARHAVITKDAVEEFIGTEVEEKRSLTYTSIWLNVLNSTESRQRLEDLQQGDQLKNGEITILSRLARGGHANLFLADMSGQTVVLKEFITTTVDARSAMIGLEEFETESSILDRISHPNLCSLIEVFSEDSRVYIALEFVEAQSLRDVVEREGQLSPDRVYQIGRELADALAYLHALSPPVIHRDISPDNVLLCGDGGLKLIDFSVACNGESDEIVDVVGKPSYMSPDQFRGRAQMNNDVYGFGATLYFALVGKDPEPISQLRPPPAVTSDGFDISELVFECMAIDSTRVFESMTALPFPSSSNTSSHNTHRTACV